MGALTRRASPGFLFAQEPGFPFNLALPLTTVNGLVSIHNRRLKKRQALKVPNTGAD